MRKDVYCSVCSIFPAPLRSHPLVPASSVGSDSDSDSPFQTSVRAGAGAGVGAASASRKASASASGTGSGSSASSRKSSLLALGPTASAAAAAAEARPRSMAGGALVVRSTSGSPMGTTRSSGSDGAVATRAGTTSLNNETTSANSYGSGGAASLDSARRRERVLERREALAKTAAAEPGATAPMPMPIPRYELSTLDEWSVSKYNIRVRDLTRAAPQTPELAAGGAATLPVGLNHDGRVGRGRGSYAKGGEDGPQSSKPPQPPRLVRSKRQALHEESEQTAAETRADGTLGGTAVCGTDGLVGQNWREYSGEELQLYGDGVSGSYSTSGDLTMLTRSSGDGGLDELSSSTCSFQTLHAEDAWLEQLAETPSALAVAVALFNENSFGFSATNVRVTDAPNSDRSPFVPLSLMRVSMRCAPNRDSKENIDAMRYALSKIQERELSAELRWPSTLRVLYSTCAICTVRVDVASGTPCSIVSCCLVSMFSIHIDKSASSCAEQIDYLDMQ